MCTSCYRKCRRVHFSANWLSPNNLSFSKVYLVVSLCVLRFRIIYCSLFPWFKSFQFPWNDLYLLVWSCQLFSLLFLSSGVCNDLREICVGEETALNCDQLDHATKNHSYLELVWIVTDMKNPGDTKLISYCGKDPNNCSLLSSLNESCFAQRIQVRTSSRGSIYVRQLWKNDALSFSCRLFLQGDKRHLITSVNHLTVTCK